ncbi:HU family DNA-binding protein [Arsenicicoccus sp. oral taxon 190]|uniref:HU family DNA-binding protein n=1 Tax=Arsenicicoccus sp. oral taxon 190 TaxID=1658671 RepID=UPI00067A04EB|nr:HU family DNA-binding protein [Arsenicicoccus sp. oral taxon 190]AKT51127.1 integration host factor [Arsenicicoccus sp. oral taxon 190]
MNRSELVHEISRRTASTPSHVDGVLDALGDLMRECAASGGKLQIAGLLTLERVERAARTGRNPRTGETIQIPAQPAVKLTPGSTLKAAARGER